MQSNALSQSAMADSADAQRSQERPMNPEHSGTATLVLRKLMKQYGSVVAVHDVSLDVVPGEFVSLLGPSGSGKTTTLMMIAGFIYPDQGQILVGNDEVTRLAPYRRNIGMVHQSYALFPHMTVARNVAFPLRMRHMKSEKIKRDVRNVLELVQLQNLAERLPGQLSGGQQQRVALARALVFRPPLLLLDEPLGALDKKLRTELQVEIKRLQKATGSTMLYVTHDQEEALSMSDRIVVMNHGRIEQCGTPQEIYNHPRSRFVADFLGATNFLTGTIVKSDEFITVRTEKGLVLQVARRQDHDGMSLSDGTSITVSIRPERVRLQAPEQASKCRAVIAGVSYYGSQVRFQLELETGDIMTAVEPASRVGMPGIGDRVELFWIPDDVWPILH
jgi:putative spermidine/putrescine transport system ATP-binding protein